MLVDLNHHQLLFEGLNAKVKAGNLFDKVLICDDPVCQTICRRNLGQTKRNEFQLSERERSPNVQQRGFRVQAPLCEEMAEVAKGGPAVSYHYLCHGSQIREGLADIEIVQGVKFSLSLQTVSGTTSLDYDVLHLTWTAEKLQLQLDMIDQRCDKSRILALASLKSGNKISALRQARELKLASESRGKCNVLLRRVEEVLRNIADAEDTKEVFEAIQSGTKAIKDRKIAIEEVQLCLDELDETLNSQKQVEKVIGSVSSYAEFDEDMKDELDKLELEESRKSSHANGTETMGTTESLCTTLSDLKLADKLVTQRPTETPNVSKVAELELAPA